MTISTQDRVKLDRLYEKLFKFFEQKLNPHGILFQALTDYVSGREVTPDMFKIIAPELSNVRNASQVVAEYLKEMGDKYKQTSKYHHIETLDKPEKKPKPTLKPKTKLAQATLAGWTPGRR